MFRFKKVSVVSSVGPDIYITAGVPGSFTEVAPIELSDSDFKALAEPGADEIHCHKSNLEDLQDVVNITHHNESL